MAEEVLASWVRRRDALASAAAYALGDVAGRRAALSDETAAALLEAATPGSAPGGAPVAEGLDAALYPFGRLEHVPDSLAPRVAKAALATLGARGVARAFAVRALGRTGPHAAGDLERVTLDHSFSPAERADAARALRSLGEEGHAAAAEALAQMAPSKDPFELLRVAGDDYGVLTSLVAALGTAVPKKSEPALFALAAIPTAGAPPSVARRLGELRCGAAAVLAKGAYDAEVLAACDAESSEAYQAGAACVAPAAEARRRTADGVAGAHEEPAREGARGGARGDRGPSGARRRGARGAGGGARRRRRRESWRPRRGSSTRTPIACSC